MGIMRITNRTGMQINVCISNSGFIYDSRNYVGDYVEFHWNQIIPYDLTVSYASQQTEYSSSQNIWPILTLIQMVVGTVLTVGSVVLTIVTAGAAAPGVALGTAITVNALKVLNIIGYSSVGLSFLLGIGGIVQVAAQALLTPVTRRGFNQYTDYNVFVDGGLVAAPNDKGALIIIEVKPLVASFMSIQNNEKEEKEYSKYRVGFPGAPFVCGVAGEAQTGGYGGYLFACDPDGDLVAAFQQSKSGNAWTSWKLFLSEPNDRIFSAVTPGGISVGKNDSGNLTIFTAVDKNRTLAWRSQTGPGAQWSNWFTQSVDWLPRKLRAQSVLGSSSFTLWGIDDKGRLRSAYFDSDTNVLGHFTDVFLPNDAPCCVDIVTAYDRKNRPHQWALAGKSTDIASVLCHRMLMPDNRWSNWDKDWNGASNVNDKVSLAAACQGGDRGLQVWLVNAAGQLKTTYQPKKDSDDWRAGWVDFIGHTPSDVKSITAFRCPDDAVWLFAIDSLMVLHFTYQTGPGGGWIEWDCGWPSSTKTEAG